MRSIIPIYKFPGETPLETIERFRLAYPEYKNQKITYAGRLDPMADGTLLLLAGDAVHKKDIYQNCDKTYRVKIVFGIQTDSYDALGMPVFDGKAPEDLTNELRALEGEIEQSLPPYSAYKIQGKPLHQWTREGRLHEIGIPSRARTIYRAEVLNEGSISSDKLFVEITERISKVNGDFRQDKIVPAWTELLSEPRNLQTATIEIHCSAGTYMRSIAHELGGFALQITRTGINYKDFT